MDTQSRFAPVEGRRKFSYRSILFAATFIIVLVASVCIDTAGILEYFKVVAGAANDTLALGAILTVASIAPLLAMGFSVTADYEEHERLNSRG
ncbi:MAG TPA: hypothetical protein VEJ40_01145 [Pseudolabrys sp.]|jgi:hypothetical protein|nr:hypothetical protein [Pseudolabrys sp.]